MVEDADDGGMGKEDRRRVVLEFMADHMLALPPRVIFRNMRLNRNITFSYSSLHNYLEEFADEGLVKRVSPNPLDDRQVKEADPEADVRAYYLITESGLEYIGREN